MGLKRNNAKGWAHLPAELICQVAHELFSLELGSTTNFSYENQAICKAKAMAAAQALDIASMVCTRWREAISTAPLWRDVVPYIYKDDARMWQMLLNHWFPASANAEQLITREHFHQARTLVCGICAIYGSKINLALSGAVSYAYIIGAVNLCKFHAQNGFCGMCLKDDNILKSEPPDYATTLSPVEPFDTWFSNIQFTCERCRIKATRQAMRRHNITSDILRFTEMEEAFANYRLFSDGSIIHLCFQVLEREWLLQHTKIRDYSLQAVASDRLLRGMSMADAMNSDLEDSYILYSEPSIRELSMREFMRKIVLDGNWFSPNDILDLQRSAPQRSSYWYNSTPLAVPVIHPTRLEQRHTEWYYIIPTLEFKEILQSFWHQTMVEVLESAFQNIIAEVLDGCLVDSKVWEYEKGGVAPGTISDPGQTLQLWSLQEVWGRLLKAEYWVTGYNWRSRKLAEHRDRRVSDASMRSKSSSASSDLTALSGSPTGTTSTFQTTPSPPPGSVEKKPTPIDTSSTTHGSDSSKSPTSPIASAPNLPDIELTGAEERLVQPVPFVPISWDILPPQSLRCIKALWIKSIHPFVACQCGICKRACKLQEEERLRGAPKRAPTGGIVINEPSERKSDDDFDEEDMLDEIEATEEDYSVLNQMEVSPELEVGPALSPEEPRNGNTPVQLVQQPATPPVLVDSEISIVPQTPPTVRPQPPLLSRIGQKAPTPIGSLSPPSCRKRSSQELESAPSSPSSAKRRRLGSGDSKLDTPSPSPLSPGPNDHPSRSENSSSDADVNPPSTQSQLAVISTEMSTDNPLYPVRLEGASGITASAGTVGLDINESSSSRTLDDDEKEVDGDIGPLGDADEDYDMTQTLVPSSQSGQS